MVIAAATVLASCNKQVIHEPEQQMGSFALQLSCEGDFTTKAQVPEVNVDDFTVRLERPADQWVKIFTYSELKEQIAENGAFPLLPGNYTITAYSPNRAAAEWNQPIFSGTSEFSIAVDQVTNVGLLCSIQNMMVTIEVSNSFSNELVDYDVTVTNGTGTLVWTKKEVEEGKAGFFTVAPLKIHVNGYRTVTSNPAVYDGVITNVAAKDHHIIRLDAVNTGAVEGLDISIDYSTNPIGSNFEVPGTGWEPIPGEPVTPDPGTGENPAPDEPSTIRLSWDGNPDLDLSPLPVEDQMDVKLTLDVDDGIKDFSVNIKSDDANFIALVSMMVSSEYVTYTDESKTAIESVTIDMVNDVNTPDVGAPTFSTILQMPYGGELVGMKTVPLDMSGLVPLIATQAASGTNHYFTLTVTDSNDVTESWTLTFYVR